jgi:two-component system, OmpR family, sensor histidine kinase SaeS
MIGPAAVIAGTTVAAGLAGTLVLRRLPTLRLQLAGLALLAVITPLAAVLLSGLVMFESGHDVRILALAVASSMVAGGGALTVARTLSRGVDRLRRASEELSHGDLSVRAPEEGPRELAALASSFNEMSERLEQLFDARTQLFAWASHDLRAPLASMQAMLEALEDGLAEPSRYLPALRDQTRALGVLVDDLFELARIDSGVLTLETHEARASALVEACLRAVGAEAQALGVRLESELSAEDAVLCCPAKVERVIFNLLANSLRHTPSDGSVAVRVRPLEAEVEITVEDTGDGLGPDAARRMFERFWRGDAARTPGRGGAGLGLAIARGLVELHGGRIWAEDRPGGGARVSFTLPAAT